MNKIGQAKQSAVSFGFNAKTAELIADSAVNEARRWFVNGDKHYFVDPQTFAVSEVNRGIVPNGAPLIDLAEAAATPAQAEKSPEAATPSEVTIPAAVTEAADTTQMPAALQGGTNPKKKKPKGETEPDPNDPDEKKENKAGKESTRTLYLSELTPLSEAVVDEAHKTVEVTLIKAGWSDNNKHYSREMLGRDMKVFEGVKAYADHPTKNEETNRPERSVRDITGYYTNIRQADDGSLKATRHFVGGVGIGTIYPLVVEAITNKPDLMGLSINALGKTKLGEVDGRKGVVVEALVKGNSVDDVTTPAAGGKYDRLLMAANDEFTTDLLQALDYDEWREARPDFAARMKDEMRTARKEELKETAVVEASQLREQLDARTKELADLTEQKAQTEKTLSDLRAESARRESEFVADRKLSESKLPESWKTELKPQLTGKSAAEMDTTIEAERKKYFAIKQPIRVTEAGGQPLTSEHLQSVEQQRVSEALGVDASQAPLPGESPEQWGRRVGKMRN